jgi:hypothetical protein
LVDYGVAKELIAATIAATPGRFKSILPEDKIWSDPRRGTTDRIAGGALLMAKN